MAEKMTFQPTSEFLRDILEALPNPVFVKDEQHRWVLLNDSFCRFTGHSREKLIGKSDKDFFPKEEADVVWSKEDAVFASGGIVENEERITDSAGREHVVLTRKTFYADRAGRRFLVGAMTDITARKQTEHALEVSERRYRRLFEAAKDGILILDVVTGKIVDVNPFLVELTGYSREHFLGRHLWEIGPFKDVAASRASFADLQAREYVRYDDLPLAASDGRRIDVEFVSNVYRVDDESVIQCNVRDITERKRTDNERQKLEEQLRASQKMEAIGGLAGGVAHDFNNLLSVILSYTEFALERAQKGDPLWNDLWEVKGAAERAKALTHQLLAFSRKQVLQPVPLSLNRVVEGIDRMLRHVLGEDIELALALAPDLGLTQADPSQMEQLLMNLVVNARDAMPDGGKLEIDTANVEIEEGYMARQMGATPGRYVQLSVTDTGFGMDGSTKSRIFEPFFTTKEMGKGTGLGLSTVYGIVKQSGGSIWVDSEPGRGTTSENPSAPQSCHRYGGAPRVPRG